MNPYRLINSLIRPIQVRRVTVGLMQAFDEPFIGYWSWAAVGGLFITGRIFVVNGY